MPIRVAALVLVSTLICAADPVMAAALQVRLGLPNVAAKLARGAPVTVAFIGGSITVGGGADGYVQQTGDWLQRTYPQAQITVVNAGINGTDSSFGAKRFDRDVLSRKPDLVLIEFAVNDGEADRTRDMERMVHKTWLADPTTDLAIFYTLAKNHLTDYQQGRLPKAAACHERVAAHYGIPTIGLAHDVAAAISAGTLAWEGFANDSCHPHAGGYRLFNASLQAALPQLLAAGTPGGTRLREPLTRDLVVYPPIPQVQPQSVPPFLTADGRPALASFAVPVPGRNWLGEPVFAPEEGARPLWRLHWIAKSTTAAMDAAIGLRKADWGGNAMAWFAEDTCFTGPEGNSLFGAKPDGRITLGFSGTECAVLVFLAPQTGTYGFRIGADRLATHQNEDTPFALHVLHVPWGEAQGRSLAHHRLVRRAIQPFTLEGSLRMVAGEELAVVVGTATPGYIRGSWDGFRCAIGLTATE